MKNRVEELRKERGISQFEFARAIRVSRQTVSSIENGKYKKVVKTKETQVLSVETCDVLKDCLLNLA